MLPATKSNPTSIPQHGYARHWDHGFYRCDFRRKKQDRPPAGINHNNNVVHTIDGSEKVARESSSD